MLEALKVWICSGLTLVGVGALIASSWLTFFIAIEESLKPHFEPTYYNTRKNSTSVLGEAVRKLIEAGNE